MPSLNTDKPRTPTAVVAVMPEQMSFPVELLQKIIIYYLNILDDLASHVDRHIKDWLSIHHTSPQLRDLLSAPSLKDHNPYKKFTADFEGQTYNGLPIDFQSAIDLFSAGVDHVNVLQSATPFPIVLTMKFTHCLAVSTEDIYMCCVCWTAKASCHRNYQFVQVDHSIWLHSHDQSNPYSQTLNIYTSISMTLKLQYTTP